MFVDPDEQPGVLVGTDVVRDAMSAVLGQTLLLRDHLQPGVADRHLHVQPCLRPYTHTAAVVVCFSETGDNWITFSQATTSSPTKVLKEIQSADFIEGNMAHSTKLTSPFLHPALS